MKKLIAGLTTTALIASLSAPAFAANFGDVKGTSSEKAAGMLKALGVVNGDVDGKFNPTNTITRAEFAKIAVKVAGLGAAADAYGINANTGFSDVPAGHWAAGYVAVAQAAGLVKGYGDGTFGTNDNVKYEDVVTVIDRILGYNDNLPGGYPSGYVVKGAALGITSNTGFQYGKAATRGDVAIIGAAALNAYSVTYSKDSNSFTTDTSASLLSKNFSNVGDKKTLTETSNTSGTSLQAGQVKINSTVYNTNSDTIIVGDSLDALVGHTVRFIADSNNVLSYVGDATTTANVVTGSLNVPGSNAVSVSGSVYSVSVNSTSYNLDSNVEYYFNGGIVNYSDFNTMAKDSDAASVVLNSSGNAQFVGVKHYNTHFIAQNIYAKTAVSKASIDGNTIEDKTVFTRNGAPANLADIQAGDVVYVAKSNGGLVTAVDAYATTKTGTLSTYTTDGTAVTSVTVDGVTYSVDSILGQSASDVAALLNQSVTLTLASNGKVAKIAATSSTATTSTLVLSNISVVHGVYVLDPTTNTTTGYTKLTFVKTDGTSASYYVAQDSSGNDKFTTASLTKGNVYSVATDSKGYVTSATASVNTASGAIATNGVDTTNKTITIGTQTYYVSANTVYFDETAANAASPVDFTKTAASSFDKLKDTQNVTIYLDDKNVGTAKAVVITGGGTSLKAARTAGAFIKKLVSYDSNNTATYNVQLNVNGTTTNLKLDTQAAYNSVGFTVGDAVYFTDGNSDGTYDTQSPVVDAVYAQKDTAITNGFTDQVGTKYVYDTNTKVYVVNFTKDSGWNANPTTRQTPTVGSVSDFAQYVQATGSTNNNLHFEFTANGTKIGLYNYVDTIVVYVGK